MELQGERLIPAGVDATWAALNDPAVLKACIAGCESLERTGADAFAAVVAVKVGPVSARFRGNLQMTNIKSPDSYTINFDGQGGVAGFGKGSADVVLRAEGVPQSQPTPLPQTAQTAPTAHMMRTRLAYVAKAQVGGKLAQIGSRLVDAAAGKIADDFFKAFEAHLQAISDAAKPEPDIAAEAVREPAAIRQLAAMRQPVSPLGCGLAALVIVALLFFLLR